MKAMPIGKNVYWVGAIDWDLRNFHGYVTQRGSSYNAYLIVDDKITLIDTVKDYLQDELLERISSVVDPASIDYIVSNHVEMDHSGSLPKILSIAKNAEVLTSLKGREGLVMHYSDNYPFRAVQNGEQVSIGQYNLTFTHTPMVHWPDNMVTYLDREKILFSNDAFGQHIASTQRYAEELGISTVMEEAKKYYANIVLPYSTQVSKALNVLNNLDISLIAPSHGVMWKEHIPMIVGEYAKWACNKTQKEALIVYDTMWGSTKKMAKAIHSAFSSQGYQSRMIDLKYTHMSDIMTYLITAEYICLGSPTLNNNMMPTVSAFLTYMKGLAPKNRKAIVFGSYGWGGQSVKQMEDILRSAQFEIMHSEKHQYIPDRHYLEELTQTIEGVIDNG